MVESFITRACAPNLMEHYTKSNQVFQLDANMGKNEKLHLVADKKF